MRLSAPQAIGITIAVLAAGALSWQYGFRSRKSREKIEGIERENAARHAESMKRIERMKQNAKAMRTGIAACDALADAQEATQPACKNVQARRAIEQGLAGSLDRMSAAKSAAEMGTICQQILDEVAAERKRCDS